MALEFLYRLVCMVVITAPVLVVTLLATQNWIAGLLIGLPCAVFSFWIAPKYLVKVFDAILRSGWSP